MQRTLISVKAHYDIDITLVLTTQLDVETIMTVLVALAAVQWTWVRFCAEDKELLVNIVSTYKKTTKRITPVIKI